MNEFTVEKHDASYHGSNTLQVLNLKVNDSKIITIDELWSLFPSHRDHILLKDRYGWTHIKDIKRVELADDGFYEVVPKADGSNPIIIDGKSSIPVYDSKYHRGFHGVAVYDWEARSISELRSEEKKPGDYLFNVDDQSFCSFSVQHSFIDRNSNVYQVDTDSGMFLINGFSMFG